MKIGYARVSTEDQNLNRQLDELKKFGCEKIYQEKITGKSMERAELEQMLEYIRENDVIVVSDLTRLSRSTKDLFTLVERVENKGANIISIKEQWLDTTTAHGRMMFTFIAGISQFERDIIAQRTKEGLASARARGRVGGRKPADAQAISTAIRMYESKLHSIAEILKTCGISKRTLYKYINNLSSTELPK